MRDPHAEFRKGRWQRPAAFIGGAVLILGALAFLVPGKQEAAPLAATTPVKATAEPAGIGASLPPERIVAPASDVAADKAAVEQRLAQEGSTKPAPERPSGIAAERDFASAFKSAAKR